MLIKFEKPVYETIWTGDVDQILSYDTESLKFTVKDMKTGKIRTHRGNLDRRYFSLINKPYSVEGQKQAMEYLLKQGLEKRKIDFCY